MVLELLGGLLAAVVFAKLLRVPYIHFIDNTAAEFVLAKGYSKADDLNALSGCFWGVAVQQKLAPWLSRVASGDNVADGPSRDDWSMLRDAVRFSPPLDAFWCTLAKVLKGAPVPPAPSLVRDLLSSSVQDPRGVVQ